MLLKQLFRYDFLELKREPLVKSRSIAEWDCFGLTFSQHFTPMNKLNIDLDGVRCEEPNRAVFFMLLKNHFESL